MLLRGFILFIVMVMALPALAEAVPAVARQGVNIRTAPSSSSSRVIGTLRAGEEVTVTCGRGWCELADGRGFVATKFLRLRAGGGGAAAPVTTEASVEPDAVVETEAALEPGPETGGIFNGPWTAQNDSGQTEIPLIIQQIGTSAEATMLVGDITTTMIGRIEGMRFIFTWQNTKNGQVVVAGEGFLNFVGDNALSGVLMHNGSVLGAMQARR